MESLAEDYGTATRHEGQGPAASGCSLIVIQMTQVRGPSLYVCLIEPKLSPNAFRTRLNAEFA